MGRKKAGKWALIVILLCAAAVCLIGGAVLRSAGRRELPVLMYHHIVPDG